MKYGLYNSLNISSAKSITLVCVNEKYLDIKSLNSSSENPFSPSYYSYNFFSSSSFYFLNSSSFFNSSSVFSSSSISSPSSSSPSPYLFSSSSSLGNSITTFYNNVNGSRYLLDTSTNAYSGQGKNHTIVVLLTNPGYILQYLLKLSPVLLIHNIRWKLF